MNKNNEILVCLKTNKKNVFNIKIVYIFVNDINFFSWFRYSLKIDFLKHVIISIDVEHNSAESRILRTYKKCILIYIYCARAYTIIHAYISLSMRASLYYAPRTRLRNYRYVKLAMTYQLGIIATRVFRHNRGVDLIIRL